MVFMNPGYIVYSESDIFTRCLASVVYRLVQSEKGGGPRVVVSTAAFHARVRGSVPGLGGLKETKNCDFPIHV